MKQSKSEFEPRNTEFFECDCYGTNDLIRAEYSKWVWKNSDGTESNDRELNITFETHLADWDKYDIRANFLVKFWQKFSWRIRNAFRILLTGVITQRGYFSPCRSLVDRKESTVENMFGYQTTKNLAKWLDTKADEIKADYEADLVKWEEERKSVTI